jgi:uncharacterized protein YybS (DUF2232 family)
MSFFPYGVGCMPDYFTEYIIILVCCDSVQIVCNIYVQYFISCEYNRLMAVSMFMLNNLAVVRHFYFDCNLKLGLLLPMEETYC